MLVAIVTGFVGLAISIFLGLELQLLSLNEILVGVAASNCASFLALILTLRAEKVAWLREKVLTRALASWTLLSTIYFILLFSLAPFLYDFDVMKWLFFPLLLSTGFAIVVFGPVQDHNYRRQQKSAHLTQ